ncbi:MAG: hypothetical protein WCX74_04560 [Candidatus Paceibacterota bacterium]
MPNPKHNLFGAYYPPDTPLYDFSEDKLIAAAAESYGGLGKIGTVAVAGTLYIRADLNTRSVAKMHWQVQCDKAWKYQLFLAHANVTGGTLTFADATAVDDEDSFALNGETFTCESTEEEATPATRQYFIGASNAAACANCATLLTDADYGVPGITTRVNAVAATDVITIEATTAPLLQFAQGTSASNEVAWAETTLAHLVPVGAQSAQQAANSTTDGSLVAQDIYGWPYAYIALSNDDGAAAATFVVRTICY